MGDITQIMGDAARQHKLRGDRARKQHTEVELDKFHPDDADRLLRFHVTKQNVADRANEQLVDFPWEAEVAYSTFHRAMDGKAVWEGVIRALEDLDSETTRNPRKYLPDGPPGDDLAAWMMQVAGMKWWHSVLGLDMPVNTLTGWASGRGLRKDRLETLRERVAEWWARVDAACARADLVRRFDDAQRAGDDADYHSDRLRSWDTWFRDKIEDGMSLDDVRAWYIDTRSKLEYSCLNMIDLTDPQDPLMIYEGGEWGAWRAHFRDGWAQWFDGRAATGFPCALPRMMPDGTDLTPYDRERQWPDRRSEEGPKDVNVGLYGLRYRSRVTPFWDDDARAVSSTSEIVAVSNDGKTWREPTEREKRGWEHPGLEIARYRAEHGESPDNSYRREMAEARRNMLLLDQQSRLSPKSREPEWKDDAVLDKALRAARREYETARDDF